MIDTHVENLIPLSEARDHVPPRRGHKVHRATLFRWAQRGLRGIKLETVKIGGARFTSLEALERFYDCLTQAQSVDPTFHLHPKTEDGLSRSPSRRRRQASRRVQEIIGDAPSKSNVQS